MSKKPIKELNVRVVQFGGIFMGEILANWVGDLGPGGSRVIGIWGSEDVHRRVPSTDALPTSPTPSRQAGEQEMCPHVRQPSAAPTNTTRQLTAITTTWAKCLWN